MKDYEAKRQCFEQPGFQNIGRFRTLSVDVCNKIFVYSDLCFSRSLMRTCRVFRDYVNSWRRQKIEGFALEKENGFLVAALLLAERFAGKTISTMALDIHAIRFFYSWHGERLHEEELQECRTCNSAFLPENTIKNKIVERFKARNKFSKPNIALRFVLKTPRIFNMDEPHDSILRDIAEYGNSRYYKYTGDDVSSDWLIGRLTTWDDAKRERNMQKIVEILRPYLVMKIDGILQLK